MNRYSRLRIRGALLLALTAGAGAYLVAQAPAAKKWTPPRTAGGRPDLQGVFDYATATPLQRPTNLGDKAVFTNEEAAAFERQNLANRQRIDDTPPAGQVGGYNQFWYEFGTRVVPDRRTSLIADPPDGRLPPLTPAAEARANRNRARLQEPADGPEMRDASERCLLGYNSGPPMVGVGYNQHVQIVQMRDHVVIHNEMVHTARIVPLDKRPRLSQSIRDVVGRAEGPLGGRHAGHREQGFQQLDVEPVRRLDWAADENLYVVERFSLSDADTIRYEFTVSDPTVWTKPWTGVASFNRTDDLMFDSLPRGQLRNVRDSARGANGRR